MSGSERIPRDEMLVASTWLVFAVASVWATRWDSYYIERELLVCQISGYMTLGFLAVSLLSTPVVRILGWCGVAVEPAFTARWGRNTGIASGLAAILHALLSITVYLDNHWMLALTMPYLRSGLLGLGVFLLLLSASIKPLAKRVGWRIWAPLYRLSFVAALFALHHLLYAPFASRSWTLILYGIGAGLSLIRLIPKRSTPRVAETVPRS
jgi:DMSO/TMAO reductase YedYZ heme-binding membrane subunit